METGTEDKDGRQAILIEAGMLRYHLKRIQNDAEIALACLGTLAGMMDHEAGRE